MDKIAPYYKAVAGALIPFLTAIGVSLDDGTLTAQDWISAVLALIVGGGVVFAVPNIPDKPPVEPEQLPVATTATTRSSRTPKKQP